MNRYDRELEHRAKELFDRKYDELGPILQSTVRRSLVRDEVLNNE
jgi:hypothetical protein